MRHLGAGAAGPADVRAGSALLPLVAAPSSVEIVLKGAVVPAATILEKPAMIFARTTQKPSQLLLRYWGKTFPVLKRNLVFPCCKLERGNQQL